MGSGMEKGAPMDKLEQTVQHERQNAQRGFEDAPQDADYNHPALKPIHDKMVSSHQRRMQQLAAKEKELDRQMQMLGAMQQQNQQYSAGSQQAAPVSSDEFDWLEPEVRPLLQDPQGGAQFRALLRSFEKRAQKSDSSGTLSQYGQTLQNLQQQLEATQAQLTQERFARQIPAFREKYASVLDEDVSKSVLEHALRNGVDLERALYATNPEVAIAQERERIRQEVREQFASEYGAALEGMDDIVSSSPNRNSKPIDSNGKLVPFAQTALEELGKGGMMRAIREGFDREEPVQQEG